MARVTCDPKLNKNKQEERDKARKAYLAGIKAREAAIKYSKFLKLAEHFKAATNS